MENRTVIATKANGSATNERLKVNATPRFESALTNKRKSHENPKFIATRFNPSGFVEASGERKITIKESTIPATIQPLLPLADSEFSPSKSGRDCKTNDNAATVMIASPNPIKA